MELSIRKTLLLVAAFIAAASIPTSSALSSELQVNATTKVKFDKVEKLGGNEPGTFYWNRVKDDMILTAAYKASAVSNSYISWGFTPKLKEVQDGANNMAKSSVYVGFKGTSGAWEVVEYYLANWKLDKVFVAKTLDTLSMEAYYDGKDLVMSLVIRLNSTLVSTPHVLWSAGPMKDAASKLIGQHKPGGYGVMDFNWTMGGSGYVEVDDKVARFKKYHAWTATVGWGIMLPIGILYARYLRPITKSIWYNVHRYNQLLGVLLGLVSFGMGLYLNHLTGNDEKEHAIFAYIIVGVCVLMLTGFIYRPGKGTKPRKTWNVVHHTLGYLAIGLIIYNIHIGFDIYPLEDKVKWVYWFFLVAVGAVAVLLEIVYLVKYGFKWYQLDAPSYPWGEEKIAGRPPPVTNAVYV